MPGICPRCNREVYFAEERLALGKVWHAFCFSCRKCRKLLDSCSVATHCGELFCKNCYVRLPSSNGNHEIKRVSRSPPSNALDVPVRDLSNYCCRRVENPTGDNPLNRKPNSQFEKCRLRGGGSDEVEANDCSEEDRKKHCLESDCANIGVVNSITTICDPPPSPTAITAWYNRQHSKCRSVLVSEKDNDTAKVKNEKQPIPQKINKYRCRSGSQQQDIGQSESNLQIIDFNGDYETNITEAQLSADKNHITTTSADKRIVACHPLYKSSTDNSITIPSRRKYVYPPIPPPRSPLPSRRRVSFCDVVFGDKCGSDGNRTTNMQDNYHGSSHNNDGTEEYSSSYDIWRADDSADKNDDNYVNINHPDDNNAMHFLNGASDNTVEDTTTKYEETGKTTGHGYHSESKAELHLRTNEKNIDHTSSKENISDVPKHSYKCTNDFDDTERMRGGCGGICLHSNPCDYCTIRGNCSPREQDPCRAVAIPCTTCSPPCIDRRGCCPSANDRQCCKKTTIKCCQPCVGEPQSCGSGGCCGSGCRGGCGKPGQTCMPSRPCTMPPCRPHSHSIGSPCSPPRPCSPQPPCCRVKKVSMECGCCGVGGGGCGRKSRNCGGGTSYCRSGSPRCRASGIRRCCINNGITSTDGACCRPRHMGCECLGGGLDCQRCGRKVYQAEMQIASGVPYHNICFSCFCCRKPLEPLTYQENCGEIYCKQCYVRNFGPQGYGYGVGAGALQTPM